MISAVLLAIYAPVVLHLVHAMMTIVLEYSLLLLHMPELCLDFWGAKRPSPLRLWDACKHRPGGRYVYRFMICLYSPYSYSIKPMVESFTQSECVCSTTDTVANQNPFSSLHACLLYTSPSPRDISGSRMPSSA